MFLLGAIPYEGVGGFVGGSLLCLPTPNVLKWAPFFLQEWVGVDFVF